MVITFENNKYTIIKLCANDHQNLKINYANPVINMIKYSNFKE